VRTLDRILVFDRGRVAEEGSHVELMQHAGLYRDLFTHQAAGLLQA
jgi:ABC-type multidrug transport system fused ATPase/permease subunit